VIYVIYFLSPLVLSLYCLIADFNPTSLVFSAVAWSAAAGGILFRRFSLVVVSAAALLFTYLMVFLASGSPMPGGTGFGLWPTVFYSLGIFVLIEIGHDCVGISRGRLTWEAYRIRGRYLVTVCVGSVIIAFLIATVAYNIGIYLPDWEFTKVILPILLLISGASGWFATRLARRNADTEGMEEDRVDSERN
jgi:hypothetical protein